MWPRRAELRSLLTCFSPGSAEGSLEPCEMILPQMEVSAMVLGERRWELAGYWVMGS